MQVPVPGSQVPAAAKVRREAPTHTGAGAMLHITLPDWQEARGDVLEEMTARA